MTTAMASTDITVREQQLRVAQQEAVAALRRVMHQPAVQARARLRFGPGPTCEQLARMLDKALVQAEDGGLAPDNLMLSGARAEAAEHIIRVRRKAHGLADWISSPTSDVTLVLRPKGLAALAAGNATEAVIAPQEVPAPVPPRVTEPETADETAVRQALFEVLDPDLGVNIVDLGFVRRVKLDEPGFATVTMTLTSPTCPLHKVMTDQMRTALAPHGIDFKVQWEWSPSWRPADISPAGRAQLEAIGFRNF
jgi:metal-sulfur cluster biosynthetic enzyme/ribosomal protein L22